MRIRQNVYILAGAQAVEAEEDKMKKALAYLFCCFIANSAKRREVRKILRADSDDRYCVLETPPPLPAGQPVEPYAFIRVCNEKPTLKCSLNSILPALQKGVIAYNDCTDGSEEIILDFCKNNPGFFSAKYDFFNVYDNETRGSKLARYSEWTLSLLPKNKWLVILDADEIYDAEKLKSAFALPKTTRDIIWLPRIQLHYDNNRLFILQNRPFNFDTDHWIIYNDENLNFTVTSSGRCEVIRILDANLRRRIFAEISYWHFPLLKHRRIDSLRGSKMAPIEEWLGKWDGKVIDTWNNTVHPKYLCDLRMLDKAYILDKISGFDLT
jgi:beta-1,4-N-acetylgalactosaminyltransferase